MRDLILHGSQNGQLTTVVALVVYQNDLPLDETREHGFEGIPAWPSCWKEHNEGSVRVAAPWESETRT